MEQIKIHEYSTYPIPYLKIDKYLFDKELIDKFTKKEMLSFRFIPMQIIGNIITLCVANPSYNLIQELEVLTQKVVRIFWCEEKDLIKKIKALKEKKEGFYINKEKEIQWKG